MFAAVDGGSDLFWQLTVRVHGDGGRGTSLREHMRDGQKGNDG